MKQLVVLTGLLIAAAVGLCHAQEFDITAFSGASGSGETAQGTSNGVGWTMSPTYLGIVPVTDGTYTGFSNPVYFSPSIPATDEIHIGAESYTLTFDEPIASALFYLRADGTSAQGIDFGIPPTLVSGDVAIVGTSAKPNTNGGIVRFDHINSTTLTHTQFVFNGVDMAWFVTTVPEPPAIVLAVLSLALPLVGRTKFCR
jgi:hypothetical protein